MQRPAAAALQSQDAQHHQQSYPRQHAQAQQYADSSFSGSYDLPQQQNMSSFASGGMIGNPATMSNGYNGMQEPSAADFSAFLSSYQPLTSNTSFDNSMPDTAHLGLAPTMGSTDALPQLDAATAAAAAAAYGSLGRSTIANASNQMEGSNHYPTLQGTSNGNAYPAVSQRGGMNSGPRLPPQHRNTQQHPNGSSNTRRSDSSATQPGHMGPGIGYEGDGSNSASTQTPAPSSSGEDQEALRVGHLGGSNGLLPPHMLSEQIRSSSSASTSSASMFGQQFGNSQQKYQPHAGQSQAPGSRARRAQSGSYGAGELNARDGLTSSGKRLSGPAITTSGTTNNPRPSHHNANPSLHQPMGKPIAAGHAASHPPGTGNQILRGADGHASGSNAASDFTRRKGWHTRIVDELLDFVHILDKDGKVLFAASSIGAITGWKPEELVGSNICDFIHPDDARDFLRGFQSCYKDRSEMVQYYRFRKKPQTAADKLKVREQVAATDVGRSASHSEEGDSSNQDSATRLPSPKFTDAARATGVINGDDDETDLVDDASDSYVVMEISGHPYFWTEGADQESAAEAAADFANGLVHSPKTKQAMSTRAEDEKFRQADNDTAAADGGEMRKRVQCFFCSGRVYPTKNIGMLDSFLELKLENERLRTLLGELSLNDGSTDHTGGSSDGRRSLEEVGYNPDYTAFDGVQPGATAGRSGNVSFDLGDGAKHVETVDVNDRRLSGHSPPGLQSNPTSPHSLGLDRGIPSADVTQEDDEESDKAESPTPGDDDADRHKKKKTKQEEGDFVCTDCGRVDSPEWRKGPLGPKTLCNACGLRWAKKVKRSGGDPNAMVGKGIQPQSGIKVQQPFADFGGGNPFADDSRHGSMSSEPQIGQISGAPGYATVGNGQPDMSMMNHNPFQQYTPHQTNHSAHSSHQIPASMQQHHLHQAQQQHQSMLGAVQGLYDQGNPFAHSQSPQQHHLGGQQMPQHLAHDVGGAGNNFLAHDASLSSVLMNPHQRPQPQHSHSAAPNMMRHMYGGGAS